ncbi:MAG: cache domain-containing protein [Myxococcales bacterium]|nr:cache domain-containing protein [Myxococcales bacterium]
MSSVRLVVLAAAAALVPLALFGGTLAAARDREARAATRQLQVALAEELASSAHAHLHRSALVLEAAARALLETTGSEEQRERAALRVLESSPELDHVALVDATGQLWRVVRERDTVPWVAPDERIERELLAAARHHGRAVGPARAGLDEARATLVVHLATDTFGLALVPLRPLSDLVARRVRMHFGGTLRSMFLVDEQGRLLAGDGLDEPLADLRAEGAVAGAPAGADSVRMIETRDTEGKLRIATVLGVEGTRWRAVVQTPVALVEAGSHASRRLALLGALASAATVLVAAWLAWRGAQATPSPSAAHDRGAALERREPGAQSSGSTDDTRSEGWTRRESRGERPPEGGQS